MRVKNGSKRISAMCYMNVMYFLFFWITVILNVCVSVASLTGYRGKILVPMFLPTPTNVTYQKGDVATLYCSVSNIGTKTITWRKQPYHVPLFIGTQRFIRIDRFYLSHRANRGEWNLLIKNVQPFDSGVYECQISSSQELRRNITLNVIDKMADSLPYIRISGTRFVEKGGIIRLQCNASGSQTPHGHIDWFKDGNLLLNRTKIGNHISITTHAILSTLTISHALMTDAGTYVCRSSDLLTTRFRVDVLKAGTPKGKREYGEFSDGTGHTSIAQATSPRLSPSLTCIITTAFHIFLRMHNR